MTYREDGYRDPGRLNTKVEILKSARPVDDFHDTHELEVIRECWAEWTPLRGDRLTSFSQAYGLVTSEVVVRHNGSPLVSGMWLRRKRDGRLAAIAGVIQVDGGGRWQQLIVREEEVPANAESAI